MNTQEPTKALRQYFIAEKIYKSAFVAMNVDEIGVLYEKIVLASLKIKDDSIARRYFNLHKRTFGPDNIRTSEILNCLTRRIEQIS